MWQSDIFSFRLGGRSAYLIGFIDDYSRYITSLGLYRSQTAEHVLETLRRGIAEYGVPKEMLTDNGRQYTNWRGTTRFEAELKKDRIKHIRSQPHHPMTLGKIERFWKSIYTEFLSRVQFDSFEEAQDRLALWVKYYNYKRPHQGIGGLCPADRFFEIQTQLRQVLERGVEDNVLLLDGEEPGKDKELTYHVNEHQSEEGDEETPTDLPGAGEVRSGTGGLERAPEAGGGVPGAGDHLAAVRELAAGGDESDDAGARSEADAGRTAAVVAEPEDGETARKDGCGGDSPEPGGGTAGLDPESGGDEEERIRRELVEKVALLGASEAAIVLELLDPGRSGHERMEPECAAESGTDPQGEVRTDECERSGAPAEDQPQDLLQMGAAGAGSDARSPLRAELGPSSRRRGWGEGADAAPDQGA
jgi:hypothetical protein